MELPNRADRATPFVEYRTVAVSEPLRQGDVLESVQLDKPMWQRHLFVITADCDLAHGKNNGRITCVPFLTADEYLLEIQMPRLANRLIEKPLSTFKEILSATGISGVSDTRVREWISEESPDAILDQVGVTGEPRDSGLLTLRAISLIDAKYSAVSDAANALVEAQLSDARPPKRENAVKKVTSMLDECYTKTPGDALFIGSIGPVQNAGYFAYLRHLELVWESEVATGPSRREVSHRRISRMDDRYCHALVQRFALVFLPIGLPSEYEDVRNLHSQLLRESVR